MKVKISRLSEAMGTIRYVEEIEIDKEKWDLMNSEEKTKALNEGEREVVGATPETEGFFIKETIELVKEKKNEEEKEIKGMELGIGRKYCRNANGAYVRAIDSIDKQLKEARGKDV